MACNCRGTGKPKSVRPKATQPKRAQPKKPKEAKGNPQTTSGGTPKPNPCYCADGKRIDPPKPTLPKRSS